MAHCKHWHNGICKDCKKNCPIKAKLARKAAKAVRPQAEKLDTDVRLASPALVEALAHGECVALLAGKLFAALSPLYTLTSPWDTVLHTAARLHDVGWIYGQKGHHKASARMIRAGAVEEVAKDLRPLVALVARYHRQTEPSVKQRRFAELASRERRGVRRMAALLRLADALDFSHADLVRDVEVVVHDDALHLLLDCPQGCPAEVERVGLKKGLFKKVFKKDVVCQCKQAPNTEVMPTEISPVMTPSAIMPEACTGEDKSLTASEQTLAQTSTQLTDAIVEIAPEAPTEQAADCTEHSTGHSTEQK